MAICEHFRIQVYISYADGGVRLPYFRAEWYFYIFNPLALMATMTVLAAINTPPSAGDKSRP